MKKILFIVLLLSSICLETAIAQINSNQKVVQISGTNTFIEASEMGTNYPNNVGRGLNFPQTDLTSWVFKTSFLDGIQYPTAYDGMIVYNTATGKTGTDAAKQGIQVDVTPGFYYFYNPNSVNNGGTSVAQGKWMRMADASTANTTTVAAGNGVSVTSTVSGNNTDYNVKVAHGKANEVLVTNTAGDAVEWTTGEKAFGIVKGTVKCTGVLQQTVNVNVKKGSVIMLTYSEPNGGAVISVAVGKVVTGASFTILFGAVPPTTANVHYMVL